MNVQFKMVVNTMNKTRRCFEKVQRRNLIEIGNRLGKASLRSSLQLKSDSAVELDKQRVEQSIVHTGDIACANALSTNRAWYVGN